MISSTLRRCSSSSRRAPVSQYSEPVMKLFFSRWCRPTMMLSSTLMWWNSAQVLEGAADAQPGPRVRIEAGDVLAAVEQLAFGQLVAAGNAVDDRGLAGAVRADDREQFALVDAEARPRSAHERHRSAARLRALPTCKPPIPPDMALELRSLSFVCNRRDPTSAVTGRPSD